MIVNSEKAKFCGSSVYQHFLIKKESVKQSAAVACFGTALVAKEHVLNSTIRKNEFFRID